MMNNQLSSPENWIEQHGDYLYGYAMFRLRDVAAAEDVVQETLLAALQSHDRFVGRSSERTWLIGILKHKIIDHYRKIGRHEISYEDDATSDDNSFQKTGEWAGHWRSECAPTNWQPDALANLERKEFWETLDRCLAELPKKTAMAFVLREVDGLSSEATCDLLALSRNNLWVMLHRARLKLRSSLEVEWFRGQDSGSFHPTAIAYQSRVDAARRELSYRTVTA